jgi:hypothetical protein
MKVNKPDDSSVESGHLSDRIGQMGANFNHTQPESIGISVHYATMGCYWLDNPIENMWL